MLKNQMSDSGKSNEAAAPQGAAFFMPGILTLKDGTTFKGKMPKWQKSDYCGELVFNTGMTGYVESLTDPSYHGQILVFTYPLIGNYGVDIRDGESDKIQASGVIMSGLATDWSHSGATMSLQNWLQSQNIPLITGVDTRALTKHLRTSGSMDGCISKKVVNPNLISYPKDIISIEEPIIYNPGKGTKKIIFVDCGAKANIIRSLQKYPIEIKRVPYDYDYTREAYDGVVMSNGPGDPADYAPTIRITKKALKINKPIFGICLGSQIMGIAAGGKTYKLKFGHHGHNQPCIDGQSKHAYITSQNHCYALDETSLPTRWRILFRNLNDKSVEGIEHTRKPFFAVQFHPEAHPGPTDTAWLFERFFKSL